MRTYLNGFVWTATILAALAATTASADTVVEARFDGGNTDTVVDGYEGRPGNGWNTPWKMATPYKQDVTATVLSSGDPGFNEVVPGGGSYLSYTATGNAASAGTSAVTRNYASSALGIHLGEPHTVEFTVRHTGAEGYPPLEQVRLSLTGTSYAQPVDPTAEIPVADRIEAGGSAAAIVRFEALTALRFTPGP